MAVGTASRIQDEAVGCLLFYSDFPNRLTNPMTLNKNTIMNVFESVSREFNQEDTV